MEETKKDVKPKINFSEIMGNVNLAALETESLKRYSVDRTRIKRALESKDIPALRQFSQYFYHNSGEYRRLVDYFGGILTNDYVIVPMVDEKDIAKKQFENRFADILTYAENSHIKETCSQIAQIVVRDGSFFGYERDLDGAITLQVLPTAYCRSRFKMLGVYGVEFNFEFFNQFRGAELEEMLSAFPEEFTSMYAKYLANRTEEQWQALDPNFARAHMLEDPVPMLSPVFLDLIELEEYKGIDKIKSKLDIYKILIQKIPLNSDNELTFQLEEIKDFHSNLRKMITNSAVDVVTTPCEVEAVDLQDKNQTLKDDVAKATNIIYSTAGTPMLLFNAGTKSGSIGLRESIRVDENLMFPLLQQFERWYDNKFHSLVSNFKFSMMFPPISQFNRKEMIDLYQNGATQGFPTKLLTMAALGISQNQTKALLQLENDILLLHEKMIPTSSSYQTPGGETGRPESEQPLSDEGDKTRDGRKNDDRATGGD